MSQENPNTANVARKLAGQKTVDTKHGVRYTASFPINLPLEKVDLYKWVTEMTDADYRSYTKAHKAMGSYFEDGIFHTINVENIGNESIIQRYELKYHSPSHVQFYSSETTAYIMRWFPAKVSVPWEMQVTRTSDATCELTCLIGVDFPSAFIKFAGWLNGLGGFFLMRHLREEGRNFARHIERKFGTVK